MSRLRKFEQRSRELRAKPMGTDLQQIRAALKRLGSPQDSYPSVLIAGTNGKGSTAAMMESIARAAECRTGLFHSPAIGDGRRHVWIDGATVSAEEFAEAFLTMADAGDLTWFEAITAAAFLIFQRRQVDLAVVEVGLGGARDCTNVIARPAVSVLVSVALDHSDVLGPDLVAITAEKCGIFRRGRPAILGRLQPEVDAEAKRQGNSRGADIRRFQEHIRRLEVCHEDRRQMRLQTLHSDLVFQPPLAGAHQMHNAALAVLTAEALNQTLPVFNPEAITRGLESCRWPGRLEWLSAGPRPILLDGAHNPAAIDSVVSYWQARKGPRLDVIFGVFRDKDAETMLRRLHPIVHRIHFTDTRHPRSRPASELGRLWAKISAASGEARHLPLTQIASLAQKPVERPLLIVGSLDLVSQARDILLPVSSP